MLNFRIEKRLAKKSGKTIVGMDEAGRGPIAGPMAVGVVLVDEKFYKSLRSTEKWWKEVNDSKKLTPANRERLFRSMKRCLRYSVGMASPGLIDKYGLSYATKVAAKRAIRMLGVVPEVVLVDGKRKFMGLKDCSERMIVKGDTLIWSIACASIAAKVTRDEYMVKVEKRYPKYNFSKHKGYGTALHMKLIKKYGPCPIHRFSFAPLKNRGFQKSSFQAKRGNVSK